jgi:hypothetical protein
MTHDLLLMAVLAGLKLTVAPWLPWWVVGYAFWLYPTMLALAAVLNHFSDTAVDRALRVARAREAMRRDQDQKDRA